MFVQQLTGFRAPAEFATQAVVPIDRTNLIATDASLSGELRGPGCINYHAAQSRIDNQQI